MSTQVGGLTGENRYDGRQSGAHASDLIKSGTADKFNAARAAELPVVSILIADK